MQDETRTISTRRSRAFRRFDQKRDSVAEGWTPVDLGGHEVVSRLHLELPPGPDAAARARAQLDQLRGNIQESALDVVRLLVTELVTNSVRHCPRKQRTPVELDVDVYSNALRVEVTDSGPGFEVDDPPQPHPDRPGGWGLCLVDRLSNRWGVERNGGTKVWFELERSGNRWEVAG